MSTANMARWAPHPQEIPLRARGGASHDAALRAGDRAGTNNGLTA